MTDILPSYICGQWQHPADDGKVLLDAATGEPIVRVSAKALDYPVVLDYARNAGGPALRDMTFQQRAGALKALGKYLSGRIPQLTELSLRTGATRRDSAIDIDGGIGVNGDDRRNDFFQQGREGAAGSTHSARRGLRTAG